MLPTTQDNRNDETAVAKKKHLLDQAESNSPGNKKKGSDRPSLERNLDLTNE